MIEPMRLPPMQREPGRRWRPAPRVANASLEQVIETRRRAHDVRDPLVVAARLLETAALFEREWKRAVRAAELGDPRVVRLLLTVSLHGGRLRHRVLAELIGVSPSTITRVMDLAESEGFVTRMFGETDERIIRCQLTGRGHELARRTALVTRNVGSRFLEADHRALAEPLTSIRNRWRPTRSGYGHRWARRQPRGFDDW